MKHKIKIIISSITLLIICGISQLISASPISRLETDDPVYQQILQITKDYYKAWSYTKDDKRYDQAERYYSKKENNQFWDPLLPLGGYRGWQAYQHVIEHVWIPAGINSAAILFSHDGSFRAWRHGNVIWTSANCMVRAEYKDTNNATIPCRGVQIWQKEKEEWLVMHEHFSTPVIPQGQLFHGTRDPEQEFRINKAFTDRTRTVAAQWGKGKISELAERLNTYYYKQGLYLYMPWPPHNGYPDWSSFNSANKEYLFLFANKISLTINDDLEATQHGDIAWTTATVTQEIIQHNGNKLLASGRQTLIWVKQEEQWLITYEHLSFPLLPKKQ